MLSESLWNSSLATLGCALSLHPSLSGEVLLYVFSCKVQLNLIQFRAIQVEQYGIYDISLMILWQVGISISDILWLRLFYLHTFPRLWLSVGWLHCLSAYLAMLHLILGVLRWVACEISEWRRLLIRKARSVILCNMCNIKTVIININKTVTVYD